MKSLRTTKKERIESKLNDLYAEWDDVVNAIHRMLNGDPVEYTIGSRTKKNRDWTLTELRSFKKEIETQIDALEDQLDGVKSRRRQQCVIFRDW